MLYVVKHYKQVTLTEDSYLAAPTSVVPLVRNLLEQNPDKITIEATEMRLVNLAGLKVNDPEQYDSLANEVKRAYQQGRVK